MSPWDLLPIHRSLVLLPRKDPGICCRFTSSWSWCHAKTLGSAVHLPGATNFGRDTADHIQNERNSARRGLLLVLLVIIVLLLVLLVVLTSKPGFECGNLGLNGLQNAGFVFP